MSFAVYLIYLAMTFIRPGEQIPELRAWPVMDIVSGVALGAAAGALLLGRGPTRLAVQTPLVLLLGLWALISVALGPLQAGASLQSVLGFAKSSVTAYLLTILNVVTQRRLRAATVVLSAAAVFLVVQSIESRRYMGAGAARDASAADDSLATPGDGGRYPQAAGGDEGRARSVGMLGDPNDLAATLLAVVPLTFGLRRRRAPAANAFFVWMPVGIAIYGIYLTRSRGGAVALASVLALSVRHRIGTLLSAALAAGAFVALLTLGFLGGRSLEMDQSVMGRIDAWSEGLQMLKSSPLWGVGFGMFTAHYPRAAHSSFVQCFAEVGLVGYFLWLGVIMLTLHDLHGINQEPSQGTERLRVWARSVSVALAGLLVGGLFLSRAYDVTLFLVVGLGTAVADLARREGQLARTRGPVLWALSVAAVAGISIMAYWLYMRLLR